MCGAEVVLLRVAHFHTRDQRECEVEDGEGDLERAAELLRSRGITVQTLLLWASRSRSSCSRRGS